MLRIRYVSDIHLNWTPGYRLPIGKDEANSLLVIAGDLSENALVGESYHPITKYEDDMLAFLQDVCNRFDLVLFVLGNHDYYGSNICDTGVGIELTMHYGKFNNLHVCSSDFTFMYDDVKIVAGTLWTDFNKGNPVDMMQAQRALFDYQNIYEDEHTKVIPADILNEHNRTIRFFEKEVTEDCIVVTHHLPSYRCLNKKFAYSPLNSCFFSDLDEFIYRKKPRYWICGHTHYQTDTKINHTRILGNPKGFIHEENVHFNPYAEIII